VARSDASDYLDAGPDHVHKGGGVDHVAGHLGILGACLF
jgi:hypothetical protein